MTAADLIGIVKDAGACAAGVLTCAPVPERERELLESWLARGCHGSMDYLQRNATLCSDPASLLPGAATIVCAAFPFAPLCADDRSDLFADYARGADYHKALRKRLKPVCRILEQQQPGSLTRICVDSAPVRERYWAVAAGLGHIGLNGQLIVPGVGCGVFLAEILWTGTVEGTPAPAKADGSTCIRCGACVRACPGAALDGRGGLNARRCLSYLTIEHRGELPENLRLAGRIYGCDVCRDVCPENRPIAPLAEFMLRPQLAAITADSLAALTEEDYDSLTTASAIRRAPLHQLLRNAHHLTNPQKP